MLEIEELVAQYTLHPEARDLYVEGRRDKGFYEWFLAHLPPTVDRNVYEIRLVNVPPAVMQAHGLSTSQKNRVVALALELSARLDKGHDHLTCVVDADFDYLLQRLSQCHVLLYTDGTSLEMYTYSIPVLDKFLTVALGGFRLTARRILDTITPILLDLFVVRAVTLDLSLGAEWLPFKRRCKVRKGGTLDFDVKAFIQGYLSKNRMLNHEAKFVARFKQLRGQLTGDPRRFIRGHDFSCLLGHYLRPKLPKRHKKLANADILTTVLLSCIDVGELRKEALFELIGARMR